MPRITMSTVFELLLCPLLLAIVGQCIEDPKTPLTCDAGTYYVGETASVTCSFHMDMSLDERTITVSRYPKNATTRTLGTEVLVCEKTGQSQKHDCKTVEGYKFEGAISNRLSLEMPSVSERFAGMYTCFVIPDKGTAPQVCELTVKAGVRSSKPKADTSSNLWLTVLLLIPVLVVVLVLTVLYYRRANARNLRHRQLDAQLEPALLQPMLIQIDGCQPAPFAYAPNDKIWNIVKGLRLQTEDCKTVMQLFNEQMDACQAHDTNAGVRMYPIHIRSVADEQAPGAFLVVDLGSPNLKVHLVKLRRIECGIRTENYSVPTHIRLGTGIQLFRFIAECVNKFVEKYGFTGKNFRRVGFVFSFPCEHDQDLTKTRLTKWTKEFNCKGVGSKDLGQWLQEALKDKSKTCNLDVKAVVNDAVGTLVSASINDSKCWIAVTVGYGFHACFMQDRKSSTFHEKHSNSEKAQTDMEIMKTELGALGEDASLDAFRTEFDRELDTLSMNPGDQILEKMVSMMYLGEIVRLVLIKLTQKKLLFKSAKHKSSNLYEKDSFDAEFVSLIESDMSEGQFLTKCALEKMKMQQCSDEDCRIVRYVCGIVLERAAHLAAAGIATLINRIGEPKVTIAIDGPSLKVYHPQFNQLMYLKAKQLVRPELKFKIVSSYNGGVKGAALIAAAVSRSSDSS